MPAVDPRLLVGPDTMDDAAALKVSDEMAVCFTADFITPVVDDAHLWGRIAAANSLSDIYAMGATPLAALNLVCWPDCLPVDMLQQLLAGGAAAATESGCLVVGGHTVDDRQPKYGMAVIGTVHPDRLVRNRGARPDDQLYLSKPLGTGIVATAAKAEFASQEQLAAAARSMATLNRAAAEVAIAGGVRAMTDVTGFGLAGHLAEMLGHDGHLGAKVSMDALPILPGVPELMNMGMIPAGAYRNRDVYQPRVVLGPDVDPAVEILLYDPQTSGGLLIAVPPERSAEFTRAATQRNVLAARIGEFDSSGTISVS
jgi:selenide,water dikinase